MYGSNGSYVGYSQVSHMTSEFDITDLLQDGKEYHSSIGNEVV